VREYVALYRKWRPQTFAEVVGQEHILRTLQNALRRGTTSHAYIFAGPRGTGKTTVARILAKAVNCERGPREEPCNECTTCSRIAAGASLDVIEIDAASNRGIDESRELRENVKYSPTDCRKKVYIIDEVHMLTTEAFNALLKTLEDPPEHVLFILATTEPHRIPATISSRCQCFYFHRLPVKAIAGRLKDIAADVGVTGPDEAYLLLARAADGSLRDALSLLDQAVSYGRGELTLAGVRELVGFKRLEIAERALSLCRGGDIGQALAVLAEAYDEGHDPRHLALGLLECLRDALVHTVGAPGGDSHGLGVTDTATLLRALDMVAEVEGRMRWSDQPRILLDVVCLRLAALFGSGLMSPDAEERAPAMEDGEDEDRPESGGGTWEDVAREIAQDSPSLGAILSRCVAEEKDQTLLLRVPSGLQGLIERKRQSLEEAYHRVTGRRVRLRIEARDDEPARPERAEAAESPQGTVERVVDLFGGTIIED